MRKDVLGEHIVPKHEPLGSMREEVIGLEEMVQSISSPVVETQEEQEEEESDPSREQPALDSYVVCYRGAQAIEDQYQHVASSSCLSCRC
jgi:hypothetical protein